ncbi:hypothetical protein [Lonepinella sp. MS14437]|uniref:hypothetical protein n=1 Tax=unclassified Lonepinella TaxID=2642006 RepID=UPI0036D837BE
MKLLRPLVAMILSAVVVMQVSAKTTRQTHPVAFTTSEQNDETGKKMLLKLFSQSVALQYTGANPSVNSEKQSIIEFKYHLKNIGQKPIKTVHWVSQFTNNGQVLLNLDAPVNFNKKGLRAGQEIDLAFPVITAQLPPAFIQAAKEGSKHINLSNIAMKIIYTDGTKLVINND